MKQMEDVKWALVASNSKDGHSNATDGLYSPAVLLALLRHERSRSDRDGSEFSLIVFDVSRIVTNGTGIQQVTRQIRDRMRSIDEVGWIDERNIGVLLPATNLAGGGIFASRICETIPVSSSIMTWKAYSYPAHWFPGGNGSLGNGSQKPGETGENHACLDDIFGDAFCRRIPAWKRCIDLIGSASMIILLSPLLLIVSLYIKCVSRGKVFFLQKRVGYRSRIFTFIKFRTMHANNDASFHRQYLKELIRNGGPMEKLDCGRDPRIILGGRIMRKFCIDELPQLFNVLRGDMSLVGPRPCIPYEAEEFLRWHAHRFDILPGMTGLWQVSGKNKLSFEQMIRLDISYMKRMSPLLDVKILFLTIPAIAKMVLEASLKKITMETSRRSKARIPELAEQEPDSNA